MTASKNETAHTIICTKTEYDALCKHLRLLRESNKEAIEEAYEHYIKRFNKNPKQYKLNPVRRRMLADAIKRHDLTTVKMAIDGMASDDWKDRSKYDDLRYAVKIINSVDNVEKWAYMKPVEVEKTDEERFLEG